MVTLVCPGCAGPLPDCFCRSGLTAGTFASAPVQEPVTFESIREAVERINKLRPTGDVPLRCRVTEYLPTLDGKHWKLIDGTLFISKECKAALVNCFEREMADLLLALMNAPDAPFDTFFPRPEL